MPAKNIDGNALAAGLRQEVAERVRRLEESGRAVHLTAILVGSTAAGELYAQRQREACQAVGINYELRTLPADATSKSLTQTIQGLNRDPSVSGIMLHLPLPTHLDATEMQYQIDPVKDVEGVNPANIGYVVYGHTLIAPCTALAVIELIKSTGVALRGAEADVATRDLPTHTRRAEVLVVAVGKPQLVKASDVREGAVVIDVGINRVVSPDGTKKTVGDVEFDAVRQRAGWITPVPGGVGPMTVAMLLKNTLRSAELATQAKNVVSPESAPVGWLESVARRPG